MSYPGYPPPAGGYPPPGGYPPAAFQPGGAQYPGAAYPPAAYPPAPYGAAPPPAPYGAPPGGYGAPPPGAAPYGAPGYGAPPAAPYGAPPAGYGAPGYGAPPAGYGAPPAAAPYGAPPAGYGAPPPGAAPYGAPPPGAAPYGAPPAGYGYGAAPPAGYGPPPAGYAAPQGYGAPPAGQPWDRSQPPPAAAAAAPAPAPAPAPAAAAAAAAAAAPDPHATFSAERPQQGSVVPFAGFSAENDAAALRKAMKGIGTDEKAIIEVLTKRTAAQRKQISVTFKTMYGKDLEKELKSELSGKFEDVVIGLLRDQAHFDAECLRKAMKGMGTDERALIEVVCTRTNDELHRIKLAYAELYKRDLEKDVISETSGHFKRLLVSCLACGRDESNRVDIALAQREAGELQAAGVGRWGTDESKFNQILSLRSFPQLRATFEEYRKLTGMDMIKTIDREMSGSVSAAFKAVVQSVINRPAYFAERLHKSMEGAGTDDETLVRIVVARSEIDMVQIKKAFFEMYHKSLSKRIAEDTSGDYKKVLCALVGEN